MRGAGGRGGIRTHGALAGTPVFKTGALNHSATLPVRISCGKVAPIASDRSLYRCMLGLAGQKQPILHHDYATPFPPRSPCDMLLSRAEMGRVGIMAVARLT